MTRAELLHVAKQRGILRRSKMNKAALIQALSQTQEALTIEFEPLVCIDTTCLSGKALAEIMPRIVKWYALHSGDIADHYDMVLLGVRHKGTTIVMHVGGAIKKHTLGMLIDPDDSVNYPVRVGKKSYMVMAREYRIII